MKRISIVLVALVMGLAVPTMAPAQFGPTNVPAPLTQPDETQNPSSLDEDTGLSTLQLVLIFGAAIAIIAVIAWVIMRDAHRAAPVGGRGRSQTASLAGAAGSKTSKSARERERDKRRKRNKAKAQRNQRKRNRPR